MKAQVQKLNCNVVEIDDIHDVIALSKEEEMSHAFDFIVLSFSIQRVESEMLTRVIDSIKTMLKLSSGKVTSLLLVFSAFTCALPVNCNHFELLCDQTSIDANSKLVRSYLILLILHYICHYSCYNEWSYLILSYFDIVIIPVLKSKHNSAST